MALYLVEVTVHVVVEADSSGEALCTGRGAVRDEASNGDFQVTEMTDEAALGWLDPGWADALPYGGQRDDTRTVRERIGGSRG